MVERLGLDEAAIRKLAPNIIYVSINGFGEKGPYADKPAYDPTVQAFSGLTTVQGGADELRPRLIRTVLPDKRRQRQPLRQLQRRWWAIAHRQGATRSSIHA
jgi:crotonobetainyl-CoA:carnitine CoA-transferase CaiB-like acyl-CoA transferase